MFIHAWVPCNASDPRRFPAILKRRFAAVAFREWLSKSRIQTAATSIHLQSRLPQSPAHFFPSHFSWLFMCTQHISLLFPTMKTGLNAYKSTRTGANERLWRFWLDKPPTHTDVIGRKLRPQSARKDASGVIYGPSNISIYHIYNRTEVR